jgi:PAS domain S-box-containing protein
MASLLTLDTLHALIDPAPVPTWVNQRGAIVYVNPAAVSLLGMRRPEEILGKPALDFIHPDFHDLVQRCLKNI